MKGYAVEERTLSDVVSDVVNDGGLVVVAQWEASEGQSDKDCPHPLSLSSTHAQAEPDARLFLISRSKDNPAQFLFYELFRDEAAIKSHQESAHFTPLHCRSGAAAARQARAHALRAAVSAARPTARTGSCRHHFDH